MSYQRTPVRQAPARPIIRSSEPRLRHFSSRQNRLAMTVRSRLVRSPAQLQGLGLSFKPPKFARRAARAVGRAVSSGAAVAAGSLIPGSGLVIGSRRAPRFIRAPKGVRRYVRTAAKVQLATGAVVAAGLLAPTILPAAAGLVPFVKKYLPGATSAIRSASSVTSTDYGPGYGAPGGGDAGGGGGDSPAPPQDQTQDETDTTPPTQAGGAGLAIGALLIGGVLLMGGNRKG